MKRYDLELGECNDWDFILSDTGGWVRYEDVADYDTRIEFIQKKSLYADYLKYLTTRDNQASKSLEVELTAPNRDKKVVEESSLTSCSVSTQQSFFSIKLDLTISELKSIIDYGINEKLSADEIADSVLVWQSDNKINNEVK